MGDLAVAQVQVRQAQAQLASLSAPVRAEDLAAAEAELRLQAQLALLQAGARPDRAGGRGEPGRGPSHAEVGADGLERHQAPRRPSRDGGRRSHRWSGQQVLAGTPVLQLADLLAWQIETDDLTELDVVKVRKPAWR